MALHFGINSFTWTSPFTDHSLGLLRKARSMGFDTFEIALEDPGHVSVAKLNAALNATGLHPILCGAFGPNRDLTHPDSRVRREALAYIRSVVKYCEAVGATLLVGPMYSATGKRRLIPAAQKRREWHRAVTGLRTAAKMAADHGVTLGGEPLNRFETDLINTADQCVRLIRDIDHPAVGVHLDTFHMNIEEKSIAAAVRQPPPLDGRPGCHCEVHPDDEVC